MVESLPGFGETLRGQWLVHEQESAFVNQGDYLLGWGVLGMCKILLGRWGKQWPGETIHYFQGAGGPLGGTFCSLHIVRWFTMSKNKK